MAGCRSFMRRQLGLLSWPSARRGVVDEAEALLDGRCLDRRASGSLFVASWVWLNVLAHRAPETLRDLPIGPVDDKGWRKLAKSLAALEPEVVREVQRSVLVPVELECLARSTGGAPHPAAVRRAICRYLAPQRSRWPRLDFPS